eukprot:CAMPEP_0179149174 /NCGR_PEP_ID=MMETSP0796-20121207/72248_1 /TAXON_ID=73915 /ORGANISM="Pyrodinium bahamense, Strain pbaha01" /LENGTH=424 /DNA_ID=CAMNT_0020849985 /DNA_START=10 /DNA_END=1281 /DNA_ORIENTATION=-
MTLSARLHTSFGLDVLLYLALLVIFVWREASAWHACRKINRYLDYFVCLYLLMAGLLICEIVQSVEAIVRIFHTDVARHEQAMAVVLVCCLPAMLATLSLCWRLTRLHVGEIGKGLAPAKHERAVHIVSLPAVYALMAVCSFVKLYNIVGAEATPEEDAIAFARYETCLYVGDLYEAWALYQFGKLTLELLDETFEERQAVLYGESTRERRPTLGGARVQRDSTRDVVLSFTAVSSLAWLGTWLLVVVCLVQAGYSLWMWCFHDPVSNWSTVSGDFHKFSYAGMVASGAAIYNIHIIEQVFGHLMTGYSPLLKFLSVKVLVFFAFWQTKILMLLQTLHLLRMSERDIKLLHAVLLVWECLASAVMHAWAWGHDEPWYRLEAVQGHGSLRGPEARSERLALASAFQPTADAKGPMRDREAGNGKL